MLGHCSIETQYANPKQYFKFSHNTNFTNNTTNLMRC